MKDIFPIQLTFLRKLTLSLSSLILLLPKSARMRDRVQPLLRMISQRVQGCSQCLDISWTYFCAHPFSFPDALHNLQNPVTPGEPRVRIFDGRRNEFTAAVNHSMDQEVLRVGPVDEGSMVVVECSTSGGRPQPDVKWMNGTHVMRNKISISTNPDSSTNITSTAKFIISRYDLGSVLTCSVSNNATHLPLIRQVSFDVRGM